MMLEEAKAAVELRRAVKQMMRDAGYTETEIELAEAAAERLVREL
jgi:hypothetical protein